jgi:lipid-binding SYLF domain-containing protein
MRAVKLVIVGLLSLFLLNGFWSGKSVEQQKAERKKESQEILQMLYKYAPEAKQMIQNSYGYATFSNTGINVLVVSTENGKGLAHDNKTGKDYYMNMFSAGGGFGMGIKDFRAVFLFRDKAAFYEFVNNGWEANAQADAAIKYKKEGDALSKAITVAPGVRLYKLTKNGIALQATIQGTKYWKDKDLN